MSTPTPGAASRIPARVGVVPLLWDLVRTPADAALGDIRRLGLRGVQWQEPFGDRVAAHDLRVAEVYAAVSCDVEGPAPDADAALATRLDRLDALDGDVLVVACDGDATRDPWAGRARSDPCPRLTPTGRRRLAEAVQRCAEQARRLGRSVAFHAHAGTWIETPTELAALLDLTDPDLVGVCLDTGHHMVGGADPVADVATYARRITHVHLKDVDPQVHAALAAGDVGGFGTAVEHRIFCPLGDGTLDLPAVISALRLVGFDGWWMLEQDSAWQPAVPAVDRSVRVLAAEWSDPAR